MTFDDDVLSALEEAFGADSAALMSEIEDDTSEASSSESFSEDESLDQVVAKLDQEINEATDGGKTAEPVQRRTRSLDDKHVLVLMGDACYGFPMNNILEIQQLPPVTYLPNLPEWVPGVCNLRGNIVSIVDLKQLLGFGATTLHPKTRLVVVKTQNQDLVTGIVVDEVVRIVEVDPSQIRRPVGPLESQLGSFLKGTYEAESAVICVFDLEATLNSPVLRLN